MADIQYRRFNQEDESQVLSLFLACFGRAQNQTQWRWEFKDGPQDSIIVLAESDSKIVGHYAILPRFLRYKGSLIRAGLVVDVMTHPQYGRRGIFVQSALEAFKACSESGISTLVGFPNDAALSGHRRVQWAEIGKVRILVRPLSASGLLKPFGGMARLPKWVGSLFEFALHVLARITLGNANKGFQVLRLEVDDLVSQQGFEEFIEASLPSSGISNARSIDWLRWRLSDPTGTHFAFLLKESDSGRILGFLILKTKEYRGMKAGAILDVLVRNGDGQLARPLVREAVKTAAGQGCEICLMLRSPAVKLTSATRASLMLPAPRRLKFIARSVGGTKLPGDFMRIGNWHVQLIDHDVI
jgi:hypothetical protein